MIIIPMAGLSSRFKKAGYDQPKYMLRAGSRSVFAHAVISFEALFDTETFVFVCRDVADTPAFIRYEISKLEPEPLDYRVVVLDAPTSGQAETVAAGVEALDTDRTEPLTIFNIDTFRPGFAFPRQIDLEAVDGYLEVFEGEGEHWSFVEPDAVRRASGRALRVAEKQRISDLCSTGLYHFRTVGMFLDLYQRTLDTEAVALQGGERFVAPLFQMAIEDGADIRYNLISRNSVIFCGEPEEYRDVCERFSL
jgi:NDP-sugar pyrophosphorylase family protein